MSDLTGVLLFPKPFIFIERFAMSRRFNSSERDHKNRTPPPVPPSPSHLPLLCRAHDLGQRHESQRLPGCEQMLEDDSPTHAAALMDTNDARKEELMDRCLIHKVASFTV